MPIKTTCVSLYLCPLTAHHLQDRRQHVHIGSWQRNNSALEKFGGPEFDLFASFRNTDNHIPYNVKVL